MKIKKICLLLLCVSVMWGAIAQKQKVTIASELERLGDIGRLPHYMNDTKLLQVSSYDTTGNNNDGFSGKYSFIRKNADSSLVIFDQQGKGVINRIWTPTPTGDTLDFYFGGAEDPSFSVKFSDLFSRKVFPFVAPLTGNEVGGYYCYFPIPFEDGCKIVFRGKKLEFYQIQHRSYPPAYDVEDFSFKAAQEASDELNEMKQRWESVSAPDAERILRVDTLLSPGETISLAEINTGGRITGFTLGNAKAFEGLHQQVDIRVTWDGENFPAIYMPVADFFGYAFGKVSMQSLLLGSKDNRNYCYFPMPFDNGAKIELIYRALSGEAQQPIDIDAELFVSREKRDRAEEGKFYAYWNSNFDPPLGTPHVFLEGEGKGHYVGTILQAQGLTPGMTLFFEGDDVTKIDGEMRLHGTGSEDYFNGGWYAMLNRWDRDISLPLHGSLNYSLPYSRTGGYRLFVPDKMPFDSQILHTIEHGPEENNKQVDYTSVAFYYADGAITQSQTAPSDKLTRVYIPDTFILYPQLMNYSVAGKVEIDGSTLRSSTGAHVRIDLSEIPKGHYKLYADMEKSPQGGEITLWQRQKQVSEPLSFYAPEKEMKEKEYLSEIDIGDFTESISLRFKEASERNQINIHRLILVIEPQE